MNIYKLPGYQLRRPLIIEIEHDAEAGYIVSDPSTGVHHYAQDLGDALTAFLRVFVNEFEFLRSNRNDLSSAMAAEFERFRQIIAIE